MKIGALLRVAVAQICSAGRRPLAYLDGCPCSASPVSAAGSGSATQPTTAPYFVHRTRSPPLPLLRLAASAAGSASAAQPTTRRSAPTACGCAPLLGGSEPQTALSAFTLHGVWDAINFAAWPWGLFLPSPGCGALLLRRGTWPACKKQTAFLLRLANFPGGRRSALVKIGALRQRRLPISSTGRGRRRCPCSASLHLPQAALRLRSHPPTEVTPGLRPRPLTGALCLQLLPPGPRSVNLEGITPRPRQPFSLYWHCLSEKPPQRKSRRSS